LILRSADPDFAAKFGTQFLREKAALFSQKKKRRRAKSNHPSSSSRPNKKDKDESQIEQAESNEAISIPDTVEALTEVSILVTHGLHKLTLS
jgi:hypothetical protein